MKNKIIIQLVILIFTGLLIQSCEDMLEPEKDNNYTVDRAYKDPVYAQGLLDRAYLMLPGDYSFNDVATDDLVSNNRANVYLRMATGEWSSQFNPMETWSNSYDAIFNLNYFLSIVDKVEWSWRDEERNNEFIKRYTAEALGMRAYFYIQLLINHGGIGENNELLGIPLITNVLSTNDDWRVPRSSYQECIDQIIQDLDNSYEVLPYRWGDMESNDLNDRVYGDENNNRINGQIVKALKSRILLHVSSPGLNNGNYNSTLVENAAVNAGEFIEELGGLAGFDTGGHLFYDQDNDVNRKEIIWRSNYGNSNNREISSFPPSAFGNGDNNPTQNIVDDFPMANGYPITEEESGYDPENPYANRDNRLSNYIIYNGNTLESWRNISTQVGSEPDGIDYIDRSTRTGYYLKKLIRTDVNLDPTVYNSRRHFYTHIRLTEIFLIYAEAANQAWGPDGDPNNFGFTARDVISAIRKRAGILADDPYLASISTTEDMASLIRTERRLELCFEGFRFWDLRRWNLQITKPAQGARITNTDFTVINVENRNFQPHMYYAPIPNSEIIKYDGLIQNKGW